MPSSLQALRSALIPLDKPSSYPPQFRQAAVLLGLCSWWEDAAHLLAIRRAGALRNHAGQIAFPGGKVEDSDDSAAMAALRESHEELGLSPQRVQLLGRLSPVPTPTGFWVQPFVGLVDTQGWEPKIDPGEVDEMLRIQKAQLFDPENYVHKGWATRDGIRYERHEYRVCEPALWGASARMLHELFSRWKGLDPLAASDPVA